MAGCAILVAGSLALVGCERGSEQSATTGAASEAASGCADVVATSTAAVEKASAKDAAWDRPTTGPRAAEGKAIVYVAQSMQNLGVAGVATGLEEASAAIGWTLKTIDGQGTPAGIQNAFNQALTLNPDGVILGFWEPVGHQDAYKAIWGK